MKDLPINWNILVKLTDDEVEEMAAMPIRSRDEFRDNVLTRVRLTLGVMGRDASVDGAVITSGDIGIVFKFDGPEHLMTEKSALFAAMDVLMGVVGGADASPHLSSSATMTETQN